MRLFSDQAGGTRLDTRRMDGGSGSRLRGRLAGSGTLGNQSGRRGMALLMVLTAIAVLTTVAVEFAYDTRVDTTLAANSRDELRAHYLARSAVNLSRLVLHFQKQFDTLGNLAPGGLGGGGLPPEVAAAIPAGFSMPKIQLWKLIPVDSGAINMFVGVAAGVREKEAPERPTELQPGKAIEVGDLQLFGTYEGAFSATIEDEESKFNLNRLNFPGTVGAIAAMQLNMLWYDERWDFLFNEDNLHGERYKREDLLIHIKDWVDEDEAGSALDRVTGQLVAGFADEKAPYSRYRPTYEPKNARFDTVEEAFLVAGIGDRLMSAFGHRLTVFPDINNELNVNTDDPMQQWANILIAAQNPDAAALRDPTVIQNIIDQINAARMYTGFLGITVQQFASILQAAGIQVRPEILNSPQQNDYFTDTSQTFRIEAVGQVGDVTRRIVAVVRNDGSEQLGKLVYWRED